MSNGPKTQAAMNAASLRYLATHTDITYLSEGSYARALVEATNKEIADLQAYISQTRTSTYINSATGPYLDLIGEMMRITRNGVTSAATSAEDTNVQFSTVVGVLSNYFPDPTNANQGLVPSGLSITTADGGITYETSQDTVFGGNLQEVFVPVIATGVGTMYNVGRHKLTVHSGPTGVTVTNLKAISNGASSESDKDFRYRLANRWTGAPSSNPTAIRLAVLGNPDVSTVTLKEFARGAGTFDALLVPVGNSVSQGNRNVLQAAIDAASAFGVSGRATEPTYVKFKITVQLIPTNPGLAGSVDANKLNAKTAILSYMDSIPIGGELIINRLRASIIEGISRDIKDIRIIDLCFGGRPHTIRNYKLLPEELFTPDQTNTTLAIEVI
jgi:uncharacterized phage protein gp47/JayE